MDNTLKDKTANGLFWGGMNTVFMQVVGLVFGVVLGRLLSPDDYGMIAMTAVFQLLAATLQDGGFRVALVNLKHPTDEEYNSVFWFNIMAGLLLFATLFVCAPLVGCFYDNEAVVPLLRYCAVTAIIASFSTSQLAWLNRNMRVKELAKSAMAAAVLSGIFGVTMALLGMSYWSLATQNMMYVLINTVLMWHYSEWNPSVRGITLAPAKRLFRFSCKILATNIANMVNTNVLNILSGHYFSAYDTGNYNQAYQWNTKCYSIVQNMVGQVAQPVLADLRGEDARQLHALRKMIRFAAFLSFPLLLGFGLVSREFIILAVTEKWVECAGMIRVLCLSGAVAPLVTLLSNVIVTHGRSDTYFWCTSSLGVLQILTLTQLWPLGVMAMVYAHVAISLLWVLVWFALANRLCGYRVTDFLCDTLPFALTAAAVMAITHYATAAIASLWVLLLARVAMAACLYFAVMKAARVRILDECIGYLARLLRR